MTATLAFIESALLAVLITFVTFVIASTGYDSVAIGLIAGIVALMGGSVLVARMAR